MTSPRFALRPAAARPSAPPLDRWFRGLSLPDLTEIEIEAKYYRSARLPSPASAVVRGLLGEQLRRRYCSTGAADCNGCWEWRGCGYAQVFGVDEYRVAGRHPLRASAAQRQLWPHERNDKGQERLRPYWLQGIPVEPAIAPGSRFAGRIITAALPADQTQSLHIDFRAALQRLGQKTNETDAARPRLSSSRGVHHAISMSTAHADTWWIEAASPILLTPRRQTDRLSECPAAPWLAPLLAAAVSRLRGLAHRFAGDDTSADPAYPSLRGIEIREGALRPWDGSIVSRRQDRRYPLENGLTGGVLLSGPAMPLIGAFLAALNHTNVGKSSSKGFGHIVVEPVR